MLWVDETGTNHESFFDLVILSVGLTNPESTKELANACHIELDHYGFAKTSSFSPSVSSRPGIFVTGSFQSPKAIPQSVAVASTAAARAKAVLASARNTQTIEKKFVEEFDISGQEKRIGVFVCACGTNIASVVDVNAVSEYAATLPHVVHVENNMFTCSSDTQDLIAESSKKNLMLWS